MRVFPAAHNCQDVRVAQAVHYAAHFLRVHFWLAHFEVLHSWAIHSEVPRYAEVVHFEVPQHVVVVHYAEVARSVEVELRCAGVVLQCVVALQRVVVVHYAGVSQSLVQALHCVSRVAPVQPFRDLAWAFHQSLNCRATQLVSVALRHLCLMAVLPTSAQDGHQLPSSVSLPHHRYSQFRVAYERVESQHQLDASPHCY